LQIAEPIGRCGEALGGGEEKRGAEGIGRQDVRKIVGQKKVHREGSRAQSRAISSTVEMRHGRGFNARIARAAKRPSGRAPELERGPAIVAWSELLRFEWFENGLRN
jgi:hypothetical protein